MIHDEEDTVQERGNDRRGPAGYEGQEDGYRGYDTDRAEAYGRGEAVPRPRRRAGVIAMAVIAAAGIGVGAAYVGGAFKDTKKDAAAAGNATPSATPVTTSQQQLSAPSQVAAPSATASSSLVTAAALIAPSDAEKAVAAFYGVADFTLVPNAIENTQPKPETEFVSKATAAKYWDTGTGKPRPSAMCGAEAPNVAIITDTGSTVTVSLYEKGQAASQQARVTVDPTAKKISAIACAAGGQPAFPGTQQLVQYYGVDIYNRKSPTPAPPSKTYAPASADGPKPWLNFDTDVCAQYQPQTWVFFAPVATTSGATWHFQYDGADYPQDVFTDPATGDIERTLCDAFPEIPAPNKSAAGKPGPQGGPDPATALVAKILDSYIYERSQMSFGAVPTDEVAGYFDSVADYDKAVHGTGDYPLLCGSKAPDTTDVAKPKVTGSVETLEVTLSFGNGAPPGTRASTPVGKELVSVDLNNMKVKSIACK